MAQTNYTPIQLYYSTTAAAVPLAANLAAGELAINTLDGKLYYKNSAGVVTLLASTAGSSGDVVGPASATDKAIATFDGTTGKLIQNNSGVTITAGILTATGFVGPLNGTVGATTPTTGNFTTVDTTDLEVTNIKAKDGTASISLADTTGIATFSKATVVSTTDNTNAALRITQLGTGNALLVEDSANPDSTPVVIDASGQIIKGYTTTVATGNDAGSSFTPGTQIHAVSSQGQASIGLFNWINAAGNESNLVFSHSKSGVIGTFGAVSSADSLGAIVFAGDDGTAFITATKIASEVDGTPGTNDMPGRLVFSTTADGASSPTERMRIRSDGGVGIGGAGAVNMTLNLSKNITGSTTAYALRASGEVQSDVTTTAIAYSSAITTAATAFTLNNLFHFRADQPALGAGSTVTNQYGFYSASGLTGATNNYGFYSDIASGTGRYNLYMNGTADNYFAGNVGVGAVTPTSGLQTAGSSSKSAFKTPNIAEVNTISATAATGTINYDVTTQSVLYYTTNASGNFTVNFRGSSGTSLNTVMQTGESISATFLVTNGATAYYNSAVQVDGSSVTPKWQGGTAPTSGNASSIDSYTYVIIKTGSAAFTVLASVTKFA